MCTCRYVQEIM